MASKTKKYRIVELINGFYVERLDEWEERKGWPWNRYTVQRSKWVPLTISGQRSVVEKWNELSIEYMNVVPIEKFNTISEAKNLIKQLQTPEEDKIKYPIYHDVD